MKTIDKEILNDFAKRQNESFGKYYKLKAKMKDTKDLYEYVQIQEELKEIIADIKHMNFMLNNFLKLIYDNEEDYETA